MISIEREFDYYLEHGFIDQIVGLINVGKEAEVYLAQSKEQLIAIKVFKERQQRSFRNRSDYYMNKIPSHRREARALKKKSTFGISLEESLWHTREIETLRLLYDAGADVPKVYYQGENSFAMEYIGDDSSCAFRLSDLRNNLPNSDDVYRQIIRNLEIFYENDIAHGDLSPYNILFFKGRVVIIDFPQSVQDRFNHNYVNLFRRDLRNINKFFKKLGVKLDDKIDTIFKY